MNIAKKASSILGFSTALLISAAAQGQSKEPEHFSRVEKLHRQHEIQLDGRERTTDLLVMRVLRKEAVDELKSYRLSHSASVQKLEVLEAYTLKANGKRVPVPKNNYQLNTNSGQARQNPMFSDWRTVTLVFPDLAVGDAIVLRHRISTLEPLFPGKVSTFDSFAQRYPYDDVRISVDYPANMNLALQSKGLQEQAAAPAAKGRMLRQWQWQNPKPVIEEGHGPTIWRLDAEPFYAFSSFRDHREIAQSYVARAEPRAAVTPRVRELAQQISAGRSSPREKVQASYEWVSQNLSYGGNCVGIGAVVPRELNQVLDNRMGDCKDHATLLQALLAAQGIESRQVLVNAGNLFDLGSLPVASLVNHAINYVPSLDLFLDATAKELPFARLPLQVQDKPVLSADASTPARTPKDPGDHVQRMWTRYQLGADGSARGSARVELEGRHAQGNRAYLRSLPREQRERLVKASFEASQLQAEGSLRSDTLEGLSDRFHYEVDFQIERLRALGANGGMGVGPMFGSPAPVHSFVQSALAGGKERHEAACLSGRSEEFYEIELPEGFSVLSVPEAKRVDTPYLRYESQYKLEGRKLSVTRQLQDLSPGTICSVQVLQSQQDALRAVLEDLQQQVLYKRV